MKRPGPIRTQTAAALGDAPLPPHARMALRPSLSLPVDPDGAGAPEPRTARAALHLAPDSAAAAVPAPAGHGAVRAPEPAEALIGRREELAALEAALLRPDGIVAGAAILHGPAGYGKSALAGELARRAAARGTRVIWIDGRGDDGREPERAVIAALDRAGMGQPESAAPDGVIAALETAGASGLVVLEEADSASDALVDLVVGLIRRVNAIPVLAICRSSGGSLGEPLRERLGGLGRARRVAFVALERLPRETAVALVRSRAGAPLSAAEEDSLCARAAGDPFLLAELARHAEPRSGAAADLPATIRGTIALRLGALSPAARALVELSTLFSGPFALHWLGLAGGAGDDELQRLADAARRAGLWRTDGADRTVVAAPAVADAIGGEWSPLRRARLHRSVAEALERLPAGERRAAARELAAQYAASTLIPGAARGVEHALAAADEAGAAGDGSNELRLLATALELARSAGPRTEGTVWIRIAAAHARALAYAPATTALEKGLELLHRGGADVAEIADAAVMTGALLRPPLACVRRELLERTVGDFSALDRVRRARLALVAQPMHWEAAGALRVARLDPEDASSRELLLAEGTEADCVLALGGIEPLEISQLARWRTRASALTDPRLRALALLGLGLRTLEAPADPDIVAMTLRDAEDCARTSGLAHAAATAAALRAAALARSGRLQAAVELADQARAELGGWPDTALTPSLALLVRMLAERHLDPDWELMGRGAWAMATATEPATYLAPALAGLTALARVNAGDRQGALLVLRDLVPVLEHSRPHEPLAGAALALAAESAACLEDEDLAAALQLVALRLRAGRAGGVSTSRDELALARLENTLGHHEAATAAFERARAAVHAYGDRTLGAIVDYEQGAALAARANPSATVLLNAARRQFAELGMTVWTGRLERAEPAPGVAHGLTPRQVEVLQLLAAGLTNRQIAERLVVSVHTVERHVRDVYGRIGTRNRAEATAYAIRIGL